jgi:hypothetical protein
MVPEGVTPPLEKAAPEPGKRIKPGRGLPPCRSARSAAAPLSPREAVAEANDCVPHMLQVLNAARKAKLRVFYALHHRFRPGDYETWKYIAPVQKAAWVHKSFEYGTWGGSRRTRRRICGVHAHRKRPTGRARQTYLRNAAVTRRFEPSFYLVRRLRLAG